MALKTCMSCGRKFTPVGFIGQVLSDNAGSLRCPDCVRQDQSDDRYAAHAHAQASAAQATIESQERQAQAAERLAHERGLAVRQLAQAQAEAALATAVAGMDDDGLRRYQAQQEASAARPVLDDAATEIALAAEVLASEGASYGGRIVDPYAEHGTGTIASSTSGATETNGAKPAQGIQEVHAWGNIDHAYGSMARVYERLRALRLQGEAVHHRNQMMEQADDLGRRLMQIRGPASSRAVAAVEKTRFRVRSVSTVLGVVGFLCVIMSVLLDSTWSFGLAAFFAIDFALLGFLMPVIDPSSGKYPNAWGLIQSHAGPSNAATKPAIVHPAAIGMSSVFIVATLAVVGYSKISRSASATDIPMESGVVPHDLLGEYGRRGGLDANARVIVTATGIMSTDTMCASSVSWTGFEEVAPSSWRFVCSPPQNIGLSTTSGGSITRMEDGRLLVSIQTSTGADCHADSLSGSLVPVSQLAAGTPNGAAWTAPVGVEDK